MRFSYPVWIRFNGCDYSLIWQTDDGTRVTSEDTDAVLVLDEKIVTASTTVVARYDLELEDSDEAVQVLDDVEELLELPASEAICAQVLDAWNLFSVIARSVSATLDDTEEASMTLNAPPPTPSVATTARTRGSFPALTENDYPAHFLTTRPQRRRLNRRSRLGQGCTRSRSSTTH